MSDLVFWGILGVLFLAGGWGLIRSPEVPVEPKGERPRRTAGDILAEREAARQRFGARGLEVPPPAGSVPDEGSA